ncbi:MAG: cyclodeaminase/cyclohydrolase family protein [Acidobacteriota bacterium]
MSRHADLPFSTLLDRIASPEPTPGGGTASALVGAIGASLLMMVAGLAKTRTGHGDERAALDRALAELTAARTRLIDLADRDAEAFDAVLAGYRLPKGTDEEKQRRRQAIQRALGDATLIPLETVRGAADALSQGETVARCGNPSAASDVRVAVELLDAAAAGASANVAVNLAGLHDTSQIDGVAAELKQLTARLAAAAAAARAALA